MSGFKLASWIAGLALIINSFLSTLKMWKNLLHSNKGDALEGCYFINSTIDEWNVKLSAHTARTFLILYVLTLNIYIYIYIFSKQHKLSSLIISSA